MFYRFDNTYYFHLEPWETEIYYSDDDNIFLLEDMYVVSNLLQQMVEKGYGEKYRNKTYITIPHYGVIECCIIPKRSNPFVMRYHCDL